MAVGAALGVGARDPLAGRDGLPDGVGDALVGDRRHHLEAADRAVAVDGELHGDRAGDEVRAAAGGMRMFSATQPLSAMAGVLKPAVMYAGASSTDRWAGAWPPTTPPTTPVAVAVAVVVLLLRLVGIGGLDLVLDGLGLDHRHGRGLLHLRLGPVAEGGFLAAGGGGGGGGLGAAAFTNFTSTTGSDFAAALIRSPATIEEGDEQDLGDRGAGEERAAPGDALAALCLGDFVEHAGPSFDVRISPERESEGEAKAAV